MYCRNCGNQISAGASVCPFCGAATGVRVVAKRRKAATRTIAGFWICIAAVFGMILGITGIIGVAGFFTSLGEVIANRKNKQAKLEFSVAGLVLGGAITLVFIVAVLTNMENSFWIQTYLG